MADAISIRDMDTDTEPRVGEQRPGGRSARVRSAILEAAAALLMEVGYDATSYEDIALRAGVHRTTVYRRWPSKPELVADALDLHTDEHVPIPNTGSFAGDLLALARSVAANIGTEGGARRSRSIVAAAATSDELAETVYAFMGRRIERAEAIVERAVARGDLPNGIDPRVALEPAMGAIWYRLLLTGEPIDDTFVEQVASLVSRGAAA